MSKKVIIDGEIKDEEEIVDLWGEGFAPAIDEEGRRERYPLIESPRVHFTRDAIVVDLRGEVKLVGEPGAVSILRIREPKAKHLRAGDNVKGEVAKLNAIIGSLLGITDKDFDEIGATDWALISRVVGCFLSAGQETAGS